jgi:acetyltransferase
MKDGTRVVVRPIAPEDEPLIVAFHNGHSPQTLRMRFFSMVKTLSRDNLIRFCHLDYDREMALVAVHRDGDGTLHILGVSRYYLDPETRTAEFALVVGDAWQGRGLGRHLMQRLIAVGGQQGVARLTGQVLRENTPMLNLVRQVGFTEEPSTEPGVVRLVLTLQDGAAAR